MGDVLIAMAKVGHDAVMNVLALVKTLLCGNA